MIDKKEMKTNILKLYVKFLNYSKDPITNYD